jgi:hypothetical protein
MLPALLVLLHKQGRSTPQSAAFIKRQVLIGPTYSVDANKLLYRDSRITRPDTPVEKQNPIHITI